MNSPFKTSFIFWDITWKKLNFSSLKILHSFSILLRFIDFDIFQRFWSILSSCKIWKYRLFCIYVWVNNVFELEHQKLAYDIRIVDLDKHIALRITLMEFTKCEQSTDSNRLEIWNWLPQRVAGYNISITSKHSFHFHIRIYI